MSKFDLTDDEGRACKTLLTHRTGTKYYIVSADDADKVRSALVKTLARALEAEWHACGEDGPYTFESLGYTPKTYWECEKWTDDDRLAEARRLLEEK